MKKIWISVIAIVILSFLVFLFYTQYLYKNVSAYDVSKLEKVDELISPNHEQKITVYLGGGILMKTDYTYIGQLENVKSHMKRNFFILPGESPNIKWLDNHHISINGKKVSDKDTYDFRKE